MSYEIAAIATIGKYDVKDDKFKTFVYACLCGDAIKEMFLDVDVQARVKFIQQMVRTILLEVIKKINKK